MMFNMENNLWVIHFVSLKRVYFLEPTQSNYWSIYKKKNLLGFSKIINFMVNTHNFFVFLTLCF